MTMARKRGKSAAYLRALRKKYRLGEFRTRRRKGTKSRRKASPRGLIRLPEQIALTDPLRMKRIEIRGKSRAGGIGAMRFGTIAGGTRAEPIPATGGGPGWDPNRTGGYVPGM